jgi:phosphoglycerol transferase MdoB-like AlkP superfamily enzyme
LPRASTIVLLLAATLATSCARVPPPPYRLNFSLTAETPRLLQAAEETAVPVAVTNTGSSAWDPERIHVSYHWLWLVPRELRYRSRTVPFQEGVRSTLPARVAPGGAQPIDARIVAPAVPGLYWLQWDMVDEGAAWFAQVAPRQPRRLVIVVPPFLLWWAPLPLLLALAGIIVLGRVHRGHRVPSWLAAFAATADVWWCAAALFAKPLVLVRDALLEPTVAAYWLTAAIALLVPVALLLVLPRRLRAWLLVALGLFGTLVILGDVVYYRFFGDILSAPALLGARQTGRVWGSIRSLLTPDLLWLLIDVPFAVWLAAISTRTSVPAWTRRRRASAALALATAVILSGAALSVPSVLAAAPLDRGFRDRAVAEQLGPFGYHVFDGWNYVHATVLRPRATEAQIAEVRNWFARRAPLRSAAGPYAGVAAGRNLIVIQVESLQDFAVDYRIAGQDVMPHLRHWTDDALRFTHVTDQTSEGRTSDAEFTAMTSLLPIDHGAVAFRFPGDHYVGAPRVLAERGYHTLSAVPFESGFWNRDVMHPSYGFQQSLFEPDFVMTEQIGWGLNDHDFLQQMVPRLERLPRPFAAWLITLSLHHPFENFPEQHKVLKLGALEGTSFGNYLHTMHFFDQALDDFRAALDRDGLLADSVVAVFGDHDAGFQHDRVLADEMGIPATNASWALADRVPFFVRVPPAVDGRRVPTGPRDLPAGQTDFAPTLLALLGVDAAPLPYVGRNLLGSPGNPPLLRPYGDWIDAAHLFLASEPAGRRCFSVATAASADRSACAEAAAAARLARDVGRLVVTDDLQQRLRDDALR